jgi:tetratricopeptide (TPR) repeat protein
MKRFFGLVLAAGIVTAITGTTSAQAADPTTHSMKEPRKDKAKIFQKLKEADRLKKEKKYDEAIEAYEDVLEAQPKNLAAILGIAWIHNERGNHAAALEFLADALEDHPDNSSVLCEVGFAAWKLDEYALALNCFARAMDENPSNWAAYIYLTAVLEEMGETELAEVVRKRKAKNENDLMAEEDKRSVRKPKIFD